MASRVKSFIAKTAALLALTLGAASLVSPSLARADAPQVSPKEKEAARALAQLGYDLFTAGKYEEAVQKLDQAEAIFHAPTHLELAGRALEKLGRLLDARERYQRAVADPPSPRASKGFQKSYADSQKALESLKQRIPTLQVKLAGLGADKASLSLDGKPLSAADLQTPRDLDPGTYKLRVEAKGAATELRTIALAEGAHQALEIVLKPPSDSAKGPLAPGLIGLGAGAVGLAVGAVTGAMSLSAVADLDKACPNRRCPASQAGDLDRAKTLSTASTIGFVAGGALAAAGAVLLVIRPFGKKQEEAAGARVQPVIGPFGVGVEGVF